MKYIFLPFRVVYKIYYLLVFILSLIITAPIYAVLLRKPSRFKNAFRFIRFHALMLLVFAGVILRVKGKENIPEKGAYIICANHSSYLDVFGIYVIFKRYFVFTGKKEIEKWPLFHVFYTSGMNILVDRQSGSGSFGALKKMAQTLREGKSLMIFPEGTRSPIAPVLLPFKEGAFSLAVQMQVPVLPVTFVTNWKLLGSAGFWFGKAGPGIADVVIHPLVSTEGMKKEDVAKLKNTVVELINSPFVLS